VAADLGFVAHAAQGDAHEISAQGARDGSAEGRLADAGRPDEAKDRPLELALELVYGQVL